MRPLAVAAALIAAVPAVFAEEPAALDAVMDPKAEVRQLATDVTLKFTEGPVWVPASGEVPGHLLFSDIPANTIYRWTPGAAGDPKDAGKTEVFRTPSAHSNGLALDPTGRLLIADHEGHLSRLETDGAVTLLAEAFEGKALNSPNDLAQLPDGTIYFTDPPFGRGRSDFGTASPRELEFCGVYWLTPSDAAGAPPAAPVLLTKDLRAPNGIAFSPDYATCYVADMGGGTIHAYTVRKDRSFGESRVFTDAKMRGVDGIKTDSDGRLYCAAAGGVWVFDPAGTHLGTIPVPQKPANLCFGGPENRTLFVTAQSGLYCVELKATGARPKGQLEQRLAPPQPAKETTP